MKGCAAELEVSDWQVIAWTSCSCDTVKGWRGEVCSVSDDGCITYLSSLLPYVLGLCV